MGIEYFILLFVFILGIIFGVIMMLSLFVLNEKINNKSNILYEKSIDYDINATKKKLKRIKEKHQRLKDKYNGGK